MEAAGEVSQSENFGKIEPHDIFVFLVRSVMLTDWAYRDKGDWVKKNYYLIMREEVINKVPI